MLLNFSRRRRWHPTPVLLPGKSHGWRSLVSCSPWGHKESDTTERLHFHFSVSCIGEGNGNPLQCSCLENHRDPGAWWPAVYGVMQSRIWLKQLSSNFSSLIYYLYFFKISIVFYLQLWSLSNPFFFFKKLALVIKNIFKKFTVMSQLCNSFYIFGCFLEKEKG